MRRLIPSLLCVFFAAAGCESLGINQQPLYSDQPPPPPSAGTERSLVFGPEGVTEEGWIATRNDRTTGIPQAVYQGPDGKLYYQDGTPVPFKSVRQQLQELSSEQRIRP